MTNKRFSICLLILVAVAHAAQAGEPAVKIVLPATVSVSQLSIPLDAVADITCSDPMLRRRISQIDVADFSKSKQIKQITQSFVLIRLQLAGIDRSEFQLSGAQTCQIEFVEPALLTDLDVEAAAAKTFQEVLGGSAQDIRVRLKGQFMASLPTGIRERRGLRAVAMPPTRANIGSVSTLVQLWDGGSLVLSRLTQFEVLQRQNVAITLASFTRDQPIDVGNLRLESRFVSKAEDQPTEKDLRNKLARRNIAPGQVISLSDLKSAPSRSQEISVRARDTIQVEALSGRLRVRLRTAIALQSGAVGDVIQFKNPESGSVRSGRVSGPGVVQVQL